MFQNLSVEDVNSVHLVCRNLHQIANLQVNPYLIFNEDSLKNLESLFQSSRIFEELEFSWGSDDFLTSPEKFEILDEYIKFTGIHVKKLTIQYVRVDLEIVQNLMNLLPNLETLELKRVEHTSTSDRKIKCSLKSTKIERIKMTECTGFAILFESLEKCAIKELELHNSFQRAIEPEVIQKFLKSQEKNLKKLIGFNCDLDFLVDLKDLRLEYLDNRNDSDVVSLEFLRHQSDLKSLGLNLSDYHDDMFNRILEVNTLESLDLWGWKNDSSGLNNLQKLKKLKRFKVNQHLCENILDHLKFGVLNNLEELDACFEDASLDSIQEMKQNTPNLKKIVINSTSSETIYALLESLDSLEALKVGRGREWTLTENIYPKIKYLEIVGFDHNVEQFTQQFPNLEFLRFTKSHFEVTESFFSKLLCGFKHLKTLYMEIWNYIELESESVLQCFQEHGKQLEDARIVFRLYGRRALLDFAVEKRPGNLFCINNKNQSFEAPWMRKIF